MSYLVLARKWRPQRFADLAGQDVVVRTLKNALVSEHLAHAYLMTGIRGVGKTTISRLMAMAVNCTAAVDGEPCGTCDSCTSIAKGNNLDVQEMDAASHTGVDDIREILDGVRYPPVTLTIKVYIIDEAHMLSKSAFNALLKTLEEPPERVLFILATTESDKLPITVRSRCQRFDLRRLNVDEISTYLQYVLGEEKITAAADALQVIARAADGSVRDALSLTERVLAFSHDNITLDDVQQSLGLIGSAQTEQLAAVILSGDAQAAVNTLRQARELGVSPQHLLQSLAEVLHHMMCCKLDVGLVPQGVSEESKTWLLQYAAAWSHQGLDMRYQVLLHGLRDMSLVDEQRGSEMIVMRLAHLNHLSPPDQALVNTPTPAAATEKKTPKNNSIAAEKVEPTVQASVAPPLAQHDSSRKVEPDSPATWQDVTLQYQELKPGIAAILEHASCELWTDTQIELHLDKHHLDTLSSNQRAHFQTWLKRDVLWLKRSEKSGESLLVQQQRTTDEQTRQRWQHAEADPNVQAIKEAFDCRLTHVEAKDN